MGILRVLSCCLISALAGCVHLTDNYALVEESDTQKLINFAQQFSVLTSDKKRRMCRQFAQQKALKNNPLLRVKQAYMVAVYPACGRLDVAISNLEDAKLKTLDHELELFLEYQIAVMRRIKKDKEISAQYKNQLKAAQDKLDEIKSIEKTLNSRGN